VAHLVDTSILMRLANVSDPQYPVALHAVEELRRRGETLHIAPQNIVEFRNAATRPKAVNGLGLPPEEADRQVAGFEALFTLVPETPQIHGAWKSLVAASAVIGKQVHDVRLVAICQVTGITHVLTLNVAHFSRFAACVPNLAVVDPNQL
jgi:predicted nucleic acid-binding protein